MREGGLPGQMKKGLPYLRCLLALCAAVVGLAADGPSAAPPQATGQEHWWDAHWSYRLTVEVVEPSRRRGINTASLNLGEQSQFCRPDGRDVRVLRGDDRPVPHRVRVQDNKTLEVLFQAPDDCSLFRVYYGNPAAETAEADWKQNLGGLFLETRPIGEPLSRPEDIPGAVQHYTAVFGRKPWGQISDVANPFGRNDLYMSIYKGTLYCPETGDYVFAVNADDMAFFGIEELASPLCWRSPGSPSMSWHDPNNPRAVRKLTVRKGIYHISYYHVQNFGAALARLGWQTPSSDTIVTVPPEAFVQYIPAEIASREALGQALSPFFVTTHLYSLKVNGLEPGFPVYRFESRMPAGQGGSGVEFRWDFGDGMGASGPTADHEFGRAESYEVAMTVKNANGGEAIVKRPVTPAAQPVKEMTLQLQVQAGRGLIGPASPLQLRIMAVGSGAAEHDFDLVTTAGGVGGQEQTARQSLHIARNARPQGQQWTEVDEFYPPNGGDLRVKVEALLHGVRVVGEDVAVLATDGPLTGLHLDKSQNLRDEEGALVVLRLADTMRRTAPLRRLCETKSGTVSMLVFDEMLGGPPGQFGPGEYTNLLAAFLSARYPEIAFKCERLAGGDEAEPLPMQSFVHVYHAMARARPNLVLLVCQPQSVINGVPMEDFEKYLEASLDQILARSRAEAILVAPPPVPGSPEMARPYAAAVKRVGLRKGIPVVDLYSRFLLLSGWESLFGQNVGREPSFLLYPNEQGQEMIAEEIGATVLENFHEELSAAVREVSLMRTAAGTP